MFLVMMDNGADWEDNQVKPVAVAATAELARKACSAFSGWKELAVKIGEDRHNRNQEHLPWPAEYAPPYGCPTLLDSWAFGGVTRTVPNVDQYHSFDVIEIPEII